MTSMPFRPSGLYKEDVTKMKEDRFSNLNQSFSKSTTTFSEHNRTGKPKVPAVPPKDPYYWFTEKQYPKSRTDFAALRKSVSPEIVEKKPRRLSPEVRHHSTFQRKGHSPNNERSTSRRSRTPIHSRSPHERRRFPHESISSKEELSFWQRKRDSFEKHRVYAPGYKHHHERSLSPSVRRRTSFEKKKSPGKSKVTYRRSRTPPNRKEKRHSTYERNQSYQSRSSPNDRHSQRKKQHSSPLKYTGSASIGLTTSVLDYEDYPEAVENLQMQPVARKSKEQVKNPFPDISTNNTLLDKSKSLITVFDPQTLDSVKVVDEPSKPIWHSEEPLSSTYMGNDYPDEEPEQNVSVSIFATSRMSVLNSKPVERQEYDNFDAEPPSYSWVGEFLDEEEKMPEPVKDKENKKAHDAQPESQFEDPNHYKTKRPISPKPVYHSSRYIKDKQSDNRIYKMHGSSVEMKKKESFSQPKHHFTQQLSPPEKTTRSMISREISDVTQHHLHVNRHSPKEKNYKISFRHEEHTSGEHTSAKTPAKNRYRDNDRRNFTEKSSKVGHKHEIYSSSKDASFQHEERSSPKGHLQPISFKLVKGETRQFGPSGAVGTLPKEKPPSEQNDDIDGFELTDDDMANYDLAQDDFEAINRICNIFKKQQAIEEKTKESKDSYDSDVKKRQPDKYGNDVPKYRSEHHSSESHFYTHSDRSSSLPYEEHYGHQYRRFEHDERRDSKGMMKEGYQRETYKFRALEQMDKREVMYSRKDDNISETDPPVGYIEGEFPKNSSRHVVSKDAPLHEDRIFWEKSVPGTNSKDKSRSKTMKNEDDNHTAIPGLDGDLLSDSDESNKNYNDFWGFKYISWFSENILETKQFEAFVQSACPPSVANNLTELPLRFLRRLANGDKHAIRCIPKQGTEAKQLLMYVGLYKSLTKGMQTLCENLGMNNIPENDSGVVGIQPSHSKLTQGFRKVVDYNKDESKIATPEKAVLQTHKTVKKSDAFSGEDFKITVITSASAPTPQISKQIEVINLSGRRTKDPQTSQPTADTKQQFKSTLIEVSQKESLSEQVPKETPMHTSTHLNAYNAGRFIEMDSHNIKITREKAAQEQHKIPFPHSYISSQNLTRTIQVPITTSSSSHSRDSRLIATGPMEKRKLSDSALRRNEDFLEPRKDIYVSKRESPPRRPQHPREQETYKHSSSKNLPSVRTFHPDLPRSSTSRAIGWEEERPHNPPGPRRTGETGRKLLRRDFSNKVAERDGHHASLSRSSREGKRFSLDSNQSQQGHLSESSRSMKRQSSHEKADCRGTSLNKTRRLSSSSSNNMSANTKQGPTKFLDQKHSTNQKSSSGKGKEKGSPSSLSTKPAAEEDSLKNVKKSTQERRPSLASKSSSEKPKEESFTKKTSTTTKKVVNVQKSEACFGGTRKRLVVFDNYSRKPPVYSTIQKINLPDFKKYVKDMALKLLNLKYDFEKYDSTKIRDFIHDASLFKPRNSKLPRAYGKEHVIHVLRGLFQNAERDKMIPDGLRRQIKLKGPNWCEISLKTFKTLQEAVFRQCSRQFQCADNLSACPMLSGVVNSFEITYPQYAGDVKAIIQLWCWTNLASSVIDSSSKLRVTRSRAAEKESHQPETDGGLKQWLCTVYDCPPFQASKYRNMEILSNKKWGKRNKKQVVDLVVSWFLEGYFRSCYNHLEHQQRKSVSGKASRSTAAKSGKSVSKKEQEQTEEYMELDDMDVMEDDLVEPPSKEGTATEYTEDDSGAPTILLF